MMNSSDDDMIPASDFITIKRHRRHTIARPVSALALVSDSSASEDDNISDDEENNDDQFDRISDILSNLIQEANDAVNCDENKSVSSIPLIRKLSFSATNNVQHNRKNRSSPAVRSGPYPSSSLSTPRRGSSSTTTPSVALVATTRNNRAGRQGGTNFLLESFRRLDSSMEMIDSLSRDLVLEETATVGSAFTNNKRKSNNYRLPSVIMKPKFDARLSALLLLPLLHVPHAIISMVFDTMSSTHSHHHNMTSSSSTLGGMVVWAFIFAITNLVVDKAGVVNSDNESGNSGIFTVNTRATECCHENSKKFLPGTFNMDRQQSKSSPGFSFKRRPTSSNILNRKMYKRRASQQQPKSYSQLQNTATTNIMQHHNSAFNLYERKVILLRRNSF